MPSILSHDSVQFFINVLVERGCVRFKFKAMFIDFKGSYGAVPDNCHMMVYVLTSVLSKPEVSRFRC